MVGQAFYEFHKFPDGFPLGSGILLLDFAKGLQDGMPWFRFGSFEMPVDLEFMISLNRQRGPSQDHGANQAVGIKYSGPAVQDIPDENRYPSLRVPPGEPRAFCDGLAPVSQ